ncbi:hypothetical protein TNCV_180291 [Trichonephila clavipes]|nr:hypothetical protein TNCV_180291 [Trichonephila clavipes]
MGSRTRGRPPTRWIDDVENDLKTLYIKNWQRVAAYRWNWRKRAVEAAKTCNRMIHKEVKDEDSHILSIFCSENEYLSHHAKTIVVTCWLLPVYTDITPPHYPHANDSVNRRTSDTIFVASVRAVASLSGLRHSCVTAWELRHV